MEGLLKSDIFFVISTVAVVIITALLAALLVYALRIFREVKKETDEIVKDVSAFRKTIERFLGKKDEKKK